MRSPAALVLAAALAATRTAVAQAGPQPAARPLTRQDVAALVKQDASWCGGWRKSDDSCEELVFLATDKDGVLQTRRYLLADEGVVELVVRQRVTLDNDGLCWTYRFVDLDIAVLNEGQRASAEQSAAMVLLMRERMADLEGKRSCERFARDAATGDILSTTTLDGAPAPELDTRFRLLPQDARIKLRGLIDFSNEPTNT